MKKTIKILLAFMAGVLTFTACGEDELAGATPNSNNVDTGVISTFTAFTERNEAVRATVDNFEIKWQSGDAIRVMEAVFPFNPDAPSEKPDAYGWNEKYAEFTLSGGEGSTQGTFQWNKQGEGIGKGEIGKTNIYAVYPLKMKRFVDIAEVKAIYRKYRNWVPEGLEDLFNLPLTEQEIALLQAYEDNTPVEDVQAEVANVKEVKGLVLPRVQTVAAGQTVDPKATLMVAEARFDYYAWSWKNLDFKNICAFVKVTTTKELDRIEVRANNNKDEYLAGGLAVNTATAQIIAVTSPTDRSSAVTLKAKDGKLAAGTYYIAVIPGTFSKGLSVKYYYDSKKYDENIISTSYTLQRNKVYDLSLQTTGTAKATINGAEVDVNWIQLWAGGPKFAAKNVDGKLTFADAIKTGNDYVWGANWRTPKKEEMEELLKAGSNTSDKVSCKYGQVGNKWGFIFTGKESDYASNSLFIPAIESAASANNGMQQLWTSTEGANNMADLLQLNYGGSLNFQWSSYLKTEEYYVLPVLSK